ncbi:phage portal protein [Streptomonospora litoralis]|nr:phage portal protein [Streptomonospora litoralis]
MSPSETEEKASELFELRQSERRDLDRKRAYLRGDPELTWLPANTPRELQALARMSRVNLCELAVKATSQQMFVDGYTSENKAGASQVWRQWQSNRWDRKQIGVNRAIGGYGVAYGIALPSDSSDTAVMRALSPRQITVAYGDDDDWPDYGLEMRPDKTWRLVDEENVYKMRRTTRGRRSSDGKRSITFEYVEETPHEQDVCPVVRYLAEEDLDDPVRGDVEAVMPLQDQINLITFHLLVAEHYGAHGRKIFIGQMVEQLEEQLRASASSSLTVRAKPSDFDVKEVSQVQLDGFIDSRESAVRYMSALSQTPTHELLGNLANISAEALVESKESNARKVRERQIIVGEGHEQLLGQAGRLVGVEVDPGARVRWKPTLDQRAMRFVELLGTIAGKLGVPKKALWHELPFSDDTIKEWEEMAEEQAAAAPPPPQREQQDQPEGDQRNNLAAV